MNYENIIVETDDNFIGEITLNRPKHLNTFNTPLALELNHAFNELNADKTVRVVILKGAGRVFCAGIDISDFFGKTPSEYREWIHTMETPIVTMSRMTKPVIAQVHGVAAANGAGLVAGADLAVMAEDARLGLTAINVGLNCVGPVIPVSRSIGRKRALELLLSGDLINAEKALDMGLVNRVVPTDDLEKETRAWAGELAKKSPVAMKNAKTAFYTSADMDYNKSFEYMNEAFARLCTTEDAKEGVSSFLERRDPVWKEK